MASMLLGASFAVTAQGRDPRQDTLYTIPVEDPALEPHSHHRVRIKWRSLEKDRRVMEYDLPSELEGLGQEIVLSESTPNNFEGPKGTAVCEDAEALLCTITYRFLERDDAAAERILDERYPDPQEREGRGTISQQFRRDPEPQGIMEALGEIEERR